MSDVQTGTAGVKAGRRGLEDIAQPLTAQDAGTQHAHQARAAT